jgi:adenylate cyclase
MRHRLTRRMLLAAVPTLALTTAHRPAHVPVYPAANEALRIGTSHYLRMTAQGMLNARQSLTEALALDSTCARAYALLSATHRQDASGWWSADPIASESLAWTYAQQAVLLARQEPSPQPSLPHALEQLGWVQAYRRQHQDALDTVTTLLAHAPDCANGYALRASILTYLGRPADALAASTHAFYLQPRVPFFYNYHQGQAHYVWSRLEPTNAQAHLDCAAACLRTALSKHDDFRPARSYLIAALWDLGQQAEALALMGRAAAKGEPLVAHLQMDDEARARAHVHYITPYANPAITAHLYQVWRTLARQNRESQV